MQSSKLGPSTLSDPGRRHVLVTGGTRGIGHALVEALVARGNRVVATGRTQQSCADAAQRLPQVRWLDVDFAEPGAAALLAGRLAQDRFDLVVLNAGVQALRDFRSDGAGEEWTVEDEVRINLVAPIELSRSLRPLLSPQATMVLITSGLALAPKRGSPVYCAAKAGLRSFSKTLRAQWAGDGLRVVEALPPLVDTDMTRGRGRGKLAPAEAARQLLRGVDRGANEIDIGATRLLRAVMRLSPALGERLMRDR
ncbi:MAG TPA: SDR family NAD(P)-dependent oxidoreductase [Pseudoxanthomonas sp.]|nr:SDR family NAD(P)-dependent oxidoreductase [Pseudoxanthomonas sp.]